MTATVLMTTTNAQDHHDDVAQENEIPEPPPLTLDPVLRRALLRALEQLEKETLQGNIDDSSHQQVKQSKF